MEEAVKTCVTKQSKVQDVLKWYRLKTVSFVNIFESDWRWVVSRCVFIIHQLPFVCCSPPVNGPLPLHVLCAFYYVVTIIFSRWNSVLISDSIHRRQEKPQLKLFKELFCNVYPPEVGNPLYSFENFNWISV